MPSFDVKLTQSQRLSLYQEKADQLVREGHAYRCFCSQERLEVGSNGGKNLRMSCVH